DEVLGSDVQHLTAPVQLQYGLGGSRVERVRRVCQPSQDAGIDQMGHYSYSPSLLTASWDRATPQSVAAPSKRRSHSSRGWIRWAGARKRSRRALRARTSGATPCWWARSFKADSSSGPSVITIAAPPLCLLLWPRKGVGIVVVRSIKQITYGSTATTVPDTF